MVGLRSGRPATKTDSRLPANLKYLIIVPAFNESKSVGKLVRWHCRTLPEFDVLVIDDGSTDDTVRQVPPGSTVVSLPFNLGIGGAMQTGYRYADLHCYDVAVQVDGDGQHRPLGVRALVRPLLAGNADIVVGSRFLGETNFRQSMPRMTGIKLLSIVDSVAGGIAHYRLHQRISGGESAGNSCLCALVSGRLPGTGSGVVAAQVGIQGFGNCRQDAAADVRPQQHQPAARLVLRAESKHLPAAGRDARAMAQGQAGSSSFGRTQMILHFIPLIFGVGVLALAVRRMRHYQLKERYTLLFVLLGLPFFILAVWPSLIGRVANMLGITYGTISLLCMLAFLLLMILNCSPSSASRIARSTLWRKSSGS